MGWRLFLPTLLAAFCIAPAAAQSYDENPSGRSLYALLDGRVTASDGEPSWLDGGFGKTRFGGNRDGNAQLGLRAVEGDLVWQPHLGWSLDATVALIAQQGQQHAVDLSEAYLSFRHSPIGAVKLSARAGLMWPPISLEHGGPAWTVTETITPSAINSWVGEEVKVVAGETTASVPLGTGRLYATGAVFAFNDTAGTLLAFRGWTLHDEKVTAFGLQALPPLNDFMAYAQAPRTSPVIELDGRPGFYGKLGWATATAKLSAFYYDNRGDPEAVDRFLQWGWRTRFAQVAAQLKLGRTVLTSQAVAGSTEMGFAMDGARWVDTRFRSAFLLATRRLGDRSSISGRIEAFGTRGRGSVEGSESSEDGWAAVLAGRRRIGSHLTVLAELLHVDSTRTERIDAAQRPAQDQTLAQIALRLGI